MTKNENLEKVVNDLEQFLPITAVSIYSFKDLQKILADHLNFLITNDFSKLISVLYRLDISENKLKQLLQNSTDVSAGGIIAEMIIERQLQKIEARKCFRGNNLFSDEEKW